MQMLVEGIDVWSSIGSWRFWKIFLFQFAAFSHRGFQLFVSATEARFILFLQNAIGGGGGYAWGYTVMRIYSHATWHSRSRSVATCDHHGCVFRAERKCDRSCCCCSQGLQKFTIKVKISDLVGIKIIIVNKLEQVAPPYSLIFWLELTCVANIATAVLLCNISLTRGHEIKHVASPSAIYHNLFNSPGLTQAEVTLCQSPNNI